MWWAAVAARLTFRPVRRLTRPRLPACLMRARTPLPPLAAPACPPPPPRHQLLWELRVFPPRVWPRLLGTIAAWQGVVGPTYQTLVYGLQ